MINLKEYKEKCSKLSNVDLLNKVIIDCSIYTILEIDKNMERFNISHTELLSRLKKIDEIESKHNSHYNEQEYKDKILSKQFPYDEITGE